MIPLTPGEHSLLRLLVRYRDQYGPEKCFPRRDHIAKKLHTSERNVSRWMTALVAFGAVERVRRCRTSNKYRILLETQELIDLHVPSRSRNVPSCVPSRSATGNISENQSDKPVFVPSCVPSTPLLKAPQPPASAPAYYTTSQEIELWRQAQHWLSTHPQLFVGPGDIGRVMHAIEDHGPEVQCVPGLTPELKLIDRKPAASAGLNNLARSVGGSE